jgi:hypothetical protein
LSKVYVTHDGEYSGRYATGVFSSRDEAEMESADVQEFELDELAGRGTLRGWWARLRMSDGGLLDQGREEIKARAREVHMEQNDKFVVAHSTVSQEHALKCAAEHRQAILRETPSRFRTDSILRTVSVTKPPSGHYDVPELTLRSTKLWSR